MGHLVLRVLGPADLWQVEDDGTWQEIALPGGDGVAALLTALSFRPDLKTWPSFLKFFYEEALIETERTALKGRLARIASYGRKEIACEQEIIAKRKPEIVGREQHHHGGDVRIDWDAFNLYRREKRQRSALSLIRGWPMAGHQGGELYLEQLIREATGDVEKKVRDTLGELGIKVPAELDLSEGFLDQFDTDRPAAWTPVYSPPDDVAAAHEEPTLHLGSPPRLSGDGVLRVSDLFEECVEGAKRLATERREAAEDEMYEWWSRGKWLGKFFAFWSKMHHRSCESVAITRTDDVYDGARFGVRDVDAPKDKATIINAPTFFGDNERKEIVCGRTNWGLAYEWAKAHGDEMLEHPSRPSVFGIDGRPVFPGIAGVHTVVRTADDFVLFGLRAADIAFHERTWSATFEEQIALGARAFTGPIDGDHNLLDTVIGGLVEEWGIERSAIDLTSCLAIGREWGRDTYRGEDVFNLSATILTACRLKLALKDVWARLDEAEGIEDVDEHRAWAGVKFATRDDVLRFVAAARDRKDNVNLLDELCALPDIDAKRELYPGSAPYIRDRGLMPTSAARLVLGSGWLETLPKIDKVH